MAFQCLERYPPDLLFRFAEELLTRSQKHFLVLSLDFDLPGKKDVRNFFREWSRACRESSSKVLDARDVMPAQFHERIEVGRDIFI